MQEINLIIETHGGNRTHSDRRVTKARNLIESAETATAAEGVRSVTLCCLCNCRIIDVAA